MSEVVLKYSEIEDARDRARNIYSELDDYKEAIQKHIISGLKDLPGTDSSNYISTAVSLAYKKCNELTSLQEDFSSLKKQLNNLVSEAKLADDTVKHRVNQIAEDNLEREGFWQKIGNGIYNLFCVEIPDSFSGLEFFDGIIDGMRKAGNSVDHWIENKILRYFNTGDGQYIRNMISACAKVVIAAGAVASAVTTLAALPVVGTVLATTAVVVGGIYLVYSVVDSYGAVTNNQAAYEYYQRAQRAEKAGNQEEKALLLGYANYYQRTDGIVDYVNKKDYGGKYLNEFIEMSSRDLEDLGKMSKIIIDVLNIVGAGLKLGAKYSMNGKDIVDYDFSKANILRNKERDILKNGCEFIGFKKGKFSITALAKEHLGIDSDGYKTVVNIVKKVDALVTLPRDIFENWGAVSKVWEGIQKRKWKIIESSEFGFAKGGIEIFVDTAKIIIEKF